MSAAPAGEGGSLADRAYTAIRDRLVMLEIRPGDPLNDDRLAAELGTGRTPVREALKRLEGDRLVVAYPRRGTFATAVRAASRVRAATPAATAGGSDHWSSGIRPSPRA